MDFDEVFIIDMGFIKLSKVNFKIKIDDFEIKYLILILNILILICNSKFLFGGGGDIGVEGFES